MNPDMTIGSEARQARSEGDTPGERVRAGRRKTRPPDSRTRLLDLSVGLVEDLRAGGQSGERFCDVFQVGLPYRGVFRWHVAGEEVVGDPNQVIFVRGGEAYRVEGPLPDGYAELIITPDYELLTEVAHAGGRRLANHPLFRRRTLRAGPELQQFRSHFRCWAMKASEVDPLAAEEVVIGMLRATIRMGERQERPRGHSTARLIRRAKEYLQGELTNRILIGDVSRAVGASPAYLTDLFRRVEGLSLHRYLVQLRLARALVELPHVDDLTSLALELGFSSHSHFSAVFRRAFACSPSQFRTTSQRAVRPRLQARVAAGLEMARQPGRLASHGESVPGPRRRAHRIPRRRATERF